MIPQDRKGALRSVVISLGVVALVVLAVFLTDNLSSHAPVPLPLPPQVAGNPPSPASQSPAASPNPLVSPSPGALTGDTVLNGSVLKGKQGSDQTWELRSSSIHYDDRKKVATATGIYCTFNNTKTKQTVHVQAKSADINLQNQDVTFNGKVVATASTGEQLEIENLRWEGKARKFYGKNSVRLSRAGSYMVGQEMVADATLQTVEIKGDVRIFLKDKDGVFGKSLPH